MIRPARCTRSVTTIADVLTVVVLPTDETHATVQLDGDLDLLCADDVTRLLAAQLSEGRRFVTVDLSRLSFFNSSGLRVLALAHDQFLAAGGRLVLAGVTPRTAQLLAITQLDKTLIMSDGSSAGHLPLRGSGVPLRH